jgi:hypothetical protein
MVKKPSLSSVASTSPELPLAITRTFACAAGWLGTIQAKLWVAPGSSPEMSAND